MTRERNESHTNRLIHESSPYLLQHAHNPVDWYAWGLEAFDAARRSNKPIFLSVGYSTCYWCHVMERQSFEVESIAEIMNEKFINIKVDREERPDVDQLYMTAIQVMTRSGGWPMSVFLTPDLRPFWGGTYFPPADAHGRPGFPTVLNAISDHFKQKPDQVEKAANQLVDIIGQIAEPVGAETRIEIDEKFIEQLIQRSTSDYEPMYGGFGGAPKFPRETLLELLLTYLSLGEPASAGGRTAELRKMTLHALDAMANGGIRDHLGGAFHRYSTDAQWLVPHFEIMLYDNAMLGWCYTEAYRQTGEARYAHVARGVFDFVLREMTSPSGAFYTAFDAEVDAQEGLSYLWTADEIERILGVEDAKVFNQVYGVDRGPNFADPHHGSGKPDKSILFLPDGPAKESDFRIIEMRRKLYEARRQRKQPLLDTKILTSWNALMIRAMAFAAKVLTEPKYFQAASQAAEFLLTNHRKPDGGFFRTSRLDAERPSPGKLDGFLDDYAFLAHALLQLERSSGESRWRKAADEIAQQMRRRFLDESRGGFYFTDRGASDLIVRQKTASDSPLPSGNAVAARIMLELGFDTIARDTIALFSPQLEAHGEGMSAMVQAALEYVKDNGPITIEPAAAAHPRSAMPADQAGSIVELAARWQTPTRLLVRASIAPGYHIHTNRPASEFIATQLFVTAAQPAAVEYPNGQKSRFAFSDEPLEVYSGEIEIAVKFAEPIVSPVQLSLQYQACDDNACLPPVTKRFEVPPP